MNPQLGARLPARPGLLLGREHDLSRVMALLHRGCWLVTLRGPGGIGKTALALHLAQWVQGLYGHVQFVDLSALRDPGEVLGSIAAALPLPAHGGDPARLIREFASQKRTLLILDNFEHLLPAALHLAELDSGEGTLQIVVTSRAALHLHDEHEHPVGPLALPESALRAASSPAVQLFVRRVQASRPSFQLGEDNALDVIRLCGILEGVPLALELAAARLRSYALPDLLAQLQGTLGGLRADFRDRPERLRSLRAAVQWSYDLLGEEERDFFECCSIFEGGFTPAAVAAVWGSTDAQGRIESLLDQSFVQRLETPDTCWKMLQPLRELAAEHVAHNPLAQTWRDRHARYFLEMIEEHERVWEAETVDRLEAYLPHYPDIRAGLVWTVEERLSDLAYRYLGALRGLWVAFGLHVRESPLIERVLALPPPGDQVTLLRALESSVASLNFTGQFQAREARLQEIVTLCRELNDVESMAWASLDLAELARDTGQGERGWEISERVIHELRERVGDHPPTRRQRRLGANAYLEAAMGLLELDRQGEALDFAQLACDSYREVGDRVCELESRIMVGYLLVFVNRLPEARLSLLTCLHDAVDRGFRGTANYALRLGLTLVAAELCEWTTLVQFMAFVNDPVLERSQSVPDRRLRQDLVRAREALGEAACQQTWISGTRLQLVDMVELAERLARTPVSPAIHSELTPREWEVLALVAQGHPDRKVARLLGISPGTASKHVGNLLGKLGLHNRVELTRWAIEHGAETPS
ncbi:ATP-binding protein [Deinococcus sp.]|uniref:ATP-binding protein n=1 Tax=Deinococcus sp. TaxID=47478 RepID=UPI003C7CEF23